MKNVFTRPHVTRRLIMTKLLPQSVPSIVAQAVAPWLIIVECVLQQGRHSYHYHWWLLARPPKLTPRQLAKGGKIRRKKRTVFQLPAYVSPTKPHFPFSGFFFSWFFLAFTNRLFSIQGPDARVHYCPMIFPCQPFHTEATCFLWLCEVLTRLEDAPH